MGNTVKLRVHMGDVELVVCLLVLFLLYLLIPKKELAVLLGHIFFCNVRKHLALQMPMNWYNLTLFLLARKAGR